MWATSKMLDSIGLAILTLHLDTNNQTDTQTSSVYIQKKMKLKDCFKKHKEFGLYEGIVDVFMFDRVNC